MGWDVLRGGFDYWMLACLLACWILLRERGVDLRPEGRDVQRVLLPGYAVLVVVLAWLLAWLLVRQLLVNNRLRQGDFRQVMLVPVDGK